MTTEQRLPYDLHDSSDLGRFTHINPSTLADSDDEAVVEADSDSDIPNLKTRIDWAFSDLPSSGQKKGTDRAKNAPKLVLPADPVMSEDMIYHLMDQNKILQSQNKALAKRVELLDPFLVAAPSPEMGFDYVHCPVPDILPHPSAQSCPPESFMPDFAPPVKRKLNGSKDKKAYTQESELWDALSRLLRVLEAATKSSTADSAAAKPKRWESSNDNDVHGSPASHSAGSYEEFMLSLSKIAFMTQLEDAERKLGINMKSKKAGKKSKSKTNTSRFVLFDGVKLPPWAWKALGIVQIFFLVFVMIQLSLVGGGMFSFFKKSPKDSLWLKF